MPVSYNLGYPYQYNIYCARNYSVLLKDIEQAGISCIPIVSAYQDAPGSRSLATKQFLEEPGRRNWLRRYWQHSWGIQVCTGTSSEREGMRWHDLDFAYKAICAAPDAVYACISALVNAVENPLLTLSKSGGLRFSCRIPDYLHPNTEAERLYIYKYTPTEENPDQTDVYLEIIGEQGYSCWDARYEILLGDLLDPPQISREFFFGPIDTLRAAIHEPAPGGLGKPEEPPPAVPESLGSYKLDLAKEALLKRGFSYYRQENDLHYWTFDAGTEEAGGVSLWEREGTVWLSAATSQAGLPTEATPVTDIWADTGILPGVPATGVSVSNDLLLVRRAKRSPLSIKRPNPILHPQPMDTDELRGTPEENAVQISELFNRDVRIINLITGEPVEKNEKMKGILVNDTAVCLNRPRTPWIVASADAASEQQSVPSFERWKPRTHNWEQVKEIPLEVRMANPFQHGNVCEDAERCEALEEKGGDPRESICPQCPVYTDCQHHGYLSQFVSLQQARLQISEIPQVFFNPRYTRIAEAMLHDVNESSETRLCVVEPAKASTLFLKCRLLRSVLEEWTQRWEQEELGAFAKAILNALDISRRTHTDPAKRVRPVMQTFARHAPAIIRQMCHVYIRSINKEMSMTEAIGLGILNIDTIADIECLPTVYQDPSWTTWHQLGLFFAHYTLDHNVPMRWDDEKLLFWVPPMLHESVKRLLIISTIDAERNFRRVFPGTEVQFLRTRPSPWKPGSHVFQIRTELYRRGTMLDHDSKWRFPGMSETGQRLFLGILAEIERMPNVKHGIITHNTNIAQLMDVAEKENVCFVTNFRNLEGLEMAFEAVEVLWIVGTPEVGDHSIWQQAQILFGDDAEPLLYKRDEKTGDYKDERIQGIYNEEIIYLLTRIIGYAGLDRFGNKKVMLLSSVELPDITYRPDTLFFDWEDFEVAGGVDKLAEVIATRQRFEAERATLTAESSRQEVERILGCSSRQANRVLHKLRGGNLRPFSYRQQILTVLTKGETKTADLIASIKGNPQSIRNGLNHLVNTGEIVHVRRGVYALP